MFLNLLEASTTTTTNSFLQMLPSIGIILVLVVAFYFLLIRPQRKREKQETEMRNSLSVGDEITTTGGIVGRIGTGMFLTTSNEAKNASTVNDPNARIVIDGCDCAITVVAPDENMYLDEDNKPIYQNLFGGIVGDCSGEEGFEFLVKDSKYSGTERGLGNKDLPDEGRAFFKNPRASSIRR